MYALRQVAVLQEWIKCGKIMTSARPSTEALESCLRRVICRGMKEGKPPVSTAQVAFWYCQTRRNLVYYIGKLPPTKEGAKRMPNQESSMNVLPPGQLGLWLAERSDIWQMKFLSDRDLVSFASRRGLSLWFDHVQRLWQPGLLRADLVASTRKLRLAGLIEVGFDDRGRHLYADERRPRRRRKGWDGSASEPKPIHPGVELLFHPFRYYVLYHIDRVLRLNMHPMQMLPSVDRYPGLLDMSISEFQRWSADPQFLEQVNKWNEITALCVATEPCAYERIFKMLRSPSRVGSEEQRERIRNHFEELSETYRRIGIEVIKGFRRDLCTSAEFLDPNKDVHTILRLTTGRYREKLKGRLGGCMLLLAMAETLRRAAEEAFSEHLREEDELGFGSTSALMKEELYGAPRILDANQKVVNEYLRQFGLDYGVRIRWYLEGPTEYGAFDHVIGKYTAIELIDLRGMFIAGKGKGVTFRGDLRNDLKAGKYSFVTIDKDRDDHVRALRSAAIQDEICGHVYLHDPDIEFANFTLSELEEIIWKIALENGADESTRARLHSAIAGVGSGKLLWGTAKKAIPELRLAGKGVSWGEKLMEFALENPEFQKDGFEEPRTRPLVESLHAALRSVHSDYFFTRKEYRIDPSNLNPVRRTDSGS